MKMFDATDAMLSQGNFQYTYNANREMTSKADSTLLSVQTYQYDGLGNLKSVWLPSGVQITYLLDAHGRRYLRKKGNTVTDVYFYDSKDQNSCPSEK